MNILKKNIKLVSLFFIVCLTITLILSSIYYLFGFSKSLYLPILFLINLIIIYIFSLKIGKSKKEENIYNSLVFIGLVIGIFFILSMIFFIGDFTIQNLLYYVIVFITSFLGILIGRRKKVSN